MKIEVDGRCVYELSQHELHVLCHDIDKDELRQDIERRMRWVVTDKYKKVRDRLIQEWFRTLQERYDTLPAKNDKLIDLIFEQPDYKPDTNWHKDNQSDHDRQYL